MLKHNTLFIIGAGASVPYGFPTGAELIRQIWQEPSLPEDVWQTIFRDEMPDRLKRFCHVLRHSASPSIDEFLQLYRDNKAFLHIGKLLIAKALCPRESDARLYSDPHHRPIEDDWLRVLWHQLRSGPNEFPKDTLSFIIYNYDRCVEHFLTSAMGHSYCNSSCIKAWETLSDLFIHPHGTLGEYSPEGYNDGRTTEFKARQDAASLIGAAENIRLFWEPHTPSNQNPAQPPPTDAMAAAINKAEVIVFLGFGFLDSNNTFLLEQLAINTEAKIHATTYKLGERRKKELVDIFSDRITMFDMQCSEYLREHFPR